ncbi:MAG: L-threonine 3-dehydrogenase [Candidatus Mcinerneyibacterium aminivorans]|uniref:L-threonine 3-dehydrogenase n=1 Tax=Candidatus Mcinerneyibacterium aminivorans TaxID=2703815 RepID=A0A5D0MDK6_9BACT|nr:MAG: L-threonine 3-dehydrogenase [Candidatus Mcinerneyibacterium aminivorans]
MKAIAKTKREKGVELIDIDKPKIKNGDDVIVKVNTASICGSDVHIYDWNDWAAARIEPVRVIGHEFCGEVVETGAGVTTVTEGDYVSSETHIGCGKCYYCKNHMKHICVDTKILGVHVDGAFTDYIRVPEENIIKNNKDLKPEIASIQEPLGNAVYTTLVEQVTAKSILVMGCGPIGLMSVNIAKASGASKIIAVDINDFRLNKAKELGADITINPKNEKVVEKIMQITDGLGVEVGLEMSGSVQAAKNLFKSMRKGGRVSLLGIFDENVSLNLNEDIIFKGLKVYGINGRIMFDTWYQIKGLLESDKLNLEPIITHKIPLEDFKKGIELIKSGKAIKVVIDMNK